MPKSNGLNGFLLHLTILLSVASSKSLVLSSDFHKQGHGRPDPLCSFKSYNGGYDTGNRHYWASAIFTGFHGYVVAGIWTLVGLGFGVFVALKHLNRSYSEITEHSDSYYFAPFMVVVVLTFIAIGASGFVLAANHNALRRTNMLKQSLLRVGTDAQHIILKVARAMKDMHHVLLPYDESISFQLSLASKKLEKESQKVRHVVYKHQHLLELSTRIWHRATVGIASIDLIFVIAALVTLLMHWHSEFIMIIFVCWILTALCWALTGFDFFLHTFAEDTCSAFKEFQQNPGNSSLNSLLPCADKARADHIMIEIGYAVHTFISKLNSKITSSIRPLGLDNHNKAFRTGLWKICDPFSDAPDYSYDPDRCSKDLILIENLPKILASFTCFKDNSTSLCSVRKKFLSEASYKVALACTHAVQGLFNIFPDLEKLTHCSFVKETFSDILLYQCRPFKISFELLWSSMMFLSIIMVMLGLVWILKAYQNRGRSFSRFSVVPR